MARAAEGKNRIEQQMAEQAENPLIPPFVIKMDENELFKRARRFVNPGR